MERHGELKAVGRNGSGGHHGDTSMSRYRTRAQHEGKDCFPRAVCLYFASGNSVTLGVPAQGSRCGAQVGTCFAMVRETQKGYEAVRCHALNYKSLQVTMWPRTSRFLQTPGVLLQQFMAPMNCARLKSVRESVSQEKSFWHVLMNVFILSCALEICCTLGGELLPTTVI